jgi:hypothetical protein
MLVMLAGSVTLVILLQKIHFDEKPAPAVERTTSFYILEFQYQVRWPLTLISWPPPGLPSPDKHADSPCAKL